LVNILLHQLEPRVSNFPEAYGSGGVILDLLPSNWQLSLSVSNSEGLKQVTYATPKDVTKVPNFALSLP